MYLLPCYLCSFSYFFSVPSYLWWCSRSGRLCCPCSPIPHVPLGSWVRVYLWWCRREGRLCCPCSPARHVPVGFRVRVYLWWCSTAGRLCCPCSPGPHVPPGVWAVFPPRSGPCIWGPLSFRCCTWWTADGWTEPERMYLWGLWTFLSVLWIRIRKFLDLPDPSLIVQIRICIWIGSFDHQAKIVKKTLTSTLLWLLYDFFSLMNDVNVPSKRGNKQNNWGKRQIFCWHLSNPQHWFFLTTSRSKSNFNYVSTVTALKLLKMRQKWMMSFGQNEITLRNIYYSSENINWILEPFSHKVGTYIEYHSVFTLVGIGTPTHPPVSQASVLLPPGRGWHTRRGVRVGGVPIPTTGENA